MRKFDRDDPRELHIAELSLSLFDQTQKLHGLGGAERELLEYASLLHGIGRHIDYENRERHSRYIIRNSSLRGFTDDEIELLGLIALYHRGSRPSKKSGKLRRAAGRAIKQRWSCCRPSCGWRSRSIAGTASWCGACTSKSARKSCAS